MIYLPMITIWRFGGLVGWRCGLSFHFHFTLVCGSFYAAWALNLTWTCYYYFPLATAIIGVLRMGCYYSCYYLRASPIIRFCFVGCAFCILYQRDWGVKAGSVF
jgi:hypothetical protein